MHHPNDDYLRQVPDVLEHPEDAITIWTMDYEPMGLEHPPAPSTTTRTYQLRKKRIAYPTKRLIGRTIHYTFEGQDVEAPIWKLTDPQVLAAVASCMNHANRVVPASFPVGSIALIEGLVYGKTFFVSAVCREDLHTITGWSDLIPT